MRAIGTKLPRLGTRKLRLRIAPRLRVQGVACGHDALFRLLHHRACSLPLSAATRKRRVPTTISTK